MSKHKLNIFSTRAKTSARKASRVPFYLKVATAVLAVGIFFGVSNSYAQDAKGKRQKTEQAAPVTNDDSIISQSIVKMDTAQISGVTRAYREYLASNGIEDNGFVFIQAVKYAKNTDYIGFLFNTDERTSLDGYQVTRFDTDGFKKGSMYHYFKAEVNGHAIAVLFGEKKK